MTLTEYITEHHKCSCPNLRMVEENDFFRTFICLNCRSEPWHITRSKVKQFAREDNQLDSIRRISDAERASYRTVFGRGYGGRAHA